MQWRFKEFSHYLKKYPAFCDKISEANDATILVPTNEAFSEISREELETRMTQDGERILGLHFLNHPPAILADDVRVNQPQSHSGVNLNQTKNY